MRHCIFCDRPISGTGDGRAREHVLPAWLQSLLGVDREQLFQGVAESETGRILRTRVHATSAFVEGRVCAECNHGWMSNLETAVQPIMARLIDGSQPISRLTPAETVILTTWTLKTAYALSYAAFDSQPIDSSRLHVLSQPPHVLPEDTIVVAQQHRSNGAFSWVQRNHWPVFPQSTAPPPPVPGNAFKIGLQIRELLLVVGHWPDVDDYIIGHDFHFALWPPREFETYDLSEVTSPFDSRAILAAFSGTLAVRLRDGTDLRSMPKS